MIIIITDYILNNVKQIINDEKKHEGRERLVRVQVTVTHWTTPAAAAGIGQGRIDNKGIIAIYSMGIYDYLNVSKKPTP